MKKNPAALLKWLIPIFFVLLGVFFQNFIHGHGFLGFISFCLAILQCLFFLVGLLRPRHLVPAKVLRTVLTGIVCLGLTVCGVTEVLILRASLGQPEADCPLLNMYLKQYDLWGTDGNDEKAFYGSKLTRMDDVYWSEKGPVTNLRQGNLTHVIFLMVLALVLLLSAVFNYVNLTVALVSKRAKEIAIRRLIGEQVLTVVLRSLCESFLFTVICFVLGCMLAILARPWF